MPNTPNATDRQLDRLRTMNPTMAALTNNATPQADLRESDALWAEFDRAGDKSC